MTGRGGVVEPPSASDWLGCAPPGGGPGGATLRFLPDWTGRPAWGGPVLVLVFDPAPT